MESENKLSRTIEVVLSRDTTSFSWLTYFLDGGGLTHASIAFDEDADHYYSFNLKGFKREYKTSLMKRPREIKRYKVAVTEEQYQALKKMIEDMESEKSRYAYAKGDVSFCILKLPNPNPDDEDKYFCSEFVARMLDESGSVKMSRSYRSYTPNDIGEELEKSGRVREVIRDSEMPSKAGKTIDAAVEGLEKGKNIVVRFARERMDDAMENADGLSPIVMTVGLGTIDKCETVYQAAATLADKVKSTVESIPEKIAHKTGGAIDRFSEKIGNVLETVEDFIPRKKGGQPADLKAKPDRRKVEDPGYPEGEIGKQALLRMNEAHAPVRALGFRNIEWKPGMEILDLGCGGGAAIAEMLDLSENSRICGLDHSLTSVEQTKERNRAYLGDRVQVVQGDVGSLPWESNSFHLVTAIESVYFWPDPAGAFREIYRVLKPEGICMVMCESCNPDVGWPDPYHNITIYLPEELKQFLQDAGFQNIGLVRTEDDMLCVWGTKKQ